MLAIPTFSRYPSQPFTYSKYPDISDNVSSEDLWMAALKALRDDLTEHINSGKIPYYINGMDGDRAFNEYLQRLSSRSRKEQSMKLLESPKDFEEYKKELNIQIPWKHEGSPEEYPCLVNSKLNHDRGCRPNEDYVHTFLYKSDVRDMAEMLEIL